MYYNKKKTTNKSKGSWKSPLSTGVPIPSIYDASPWLQRLLPPKDSTHIGPVKKGKKVKKEGSSDRIVSDDAKSRKMKAAAQNVPSPPLDMLVTAATAVQKHVLMEKGSGAGAAGRRARTKFAARNMKIDSRLEYDSIEDSSSEDRDEDMKQAAILMKTTEEDDDEVFVVKVLDKNGKELGDNVKLGSNRVLVSELIRRKKVETVQYHNKRMKKNSVTGEVLMPVCVHCNEYLSKCHNKTIGPYLLDSWNRFMHDRVEEDPALRDDIDVLKQRNHYHVQYEIIQGFLSWGRDRTFEMDIGYGVLPTCIVNRYFKKGKAAMIEFLEEVEEKLEKEKERDGYPSDSSASVIIPWGNEFYTKNDNGEGEEDKNE